MRSTWKSGSRVCVAAVSDTVACVMATEPRLILDLPALSPHMRLRLQAQDSDLSGVALVERGKKSQTSWTGRLICGKPICVWGRGLLNFFN